ncbi:radical SAM protein [Streptomyces sp. NPDC005533]|uniref:radical SAM protein n=1 Tax=Streptomyces sp. NPDC005533 TaxID=3364723 RepID=UPI0036A6EC68
MIGTRLDDVDSPRLIRSNYGWWFLGNETWTLLEPGQVLPDGTVCADIDEFLQEKGAYQPRLPKAFALTVLTTTTCNLGCGYCFQNTALDPTGGNRPSRIGRQRLDSETIDRIIKFTAERMACADLRKLDVLLFGGEPLLNPQGCLTVLDRARSIGMRAASIATNGVLLTPEMAQDLNTAGLTSAQVTFDGNRELHDQIRVTHAGGATFDNIVNNVARASEVTDLQWTLRINVSHRNYEGIGKVFSEWEGRLDPNRCLLSFAWVGDAGFGYANDLQKVAEVGKAFVDWHIAAAEAGYQIVRPGMKTTCQTCSVPGGRHGAVVNADGSLYSCWQSAGKPNFKVGSVEDGYMNTEHTAQRWVQCGYEYKTAAKPAVDDFQDRIDGQILDYLYETGRL